MFGSFALIISAIATYASWRQFRIIEEDRNNSYKVAIYSERINLYNELSKSQAEFDNAFNCLMAAMAGDKRLGPKNQNEIDVCINTVMTEATKLNNVVLQTEALFPKVVIKKSHDFQEHLGNLVICSMAEVIGDVPNEKRKMEAKEKCSSSPTFDYYQSKKQLNSQILKSLSSPIEVD